MSVREILSSVVLMILIAASSAAADESTPIRIVPDGLRKVEESFVKILGKYSHVLSFARFTYKYGKKYQNEEEIKHCFSVFKDNLELIKSTNKKGLSYKLGVNQFSDLTFQELQRNHDGAAQHPFATLKGRHLLTEAAIPETRDWRKDGIVSRVKDQGRCGSAWAFSATGAVESAYHKKYGIGIDLSEQQLIDCSYLRYGPFGTFGCTGGRPSQAFDYIKSEGLLSGEKYPYIQNRGTCKHNGNNSLVNVTGYVRITSGAEDELKQAVGSIGPVSVSIVVTASLQRYRSGVYTSNDCGNILGVNHYALVVGYGIENGVPYWIIKNSWGEGWGEKGYFRVERGKNMCGVATRATYPVVA